MTFTYDSIADLTPEQFLERFQGFNKLIQTELEIAKNLAEDETYNFKSGITYFERKDLISDSIYDRDMEETVEIINEFKIEIAEFEGNRGFIVENREEIYDYSDSDAEIEFIEFIGYKASWLVPKHLIHENNIEANFKEFVKSWIAPEGTSSFERKYVDCKLLTLFKDGKIDWNTLRTLVYSECSL